MLIFGSKLLNQNLYSIRSAGKIGVATSPIINPHNLHIDGFYATAMNGQNEGVILDIDIREFSFKGIIINNHEDIADPNDLVRLKPILDINYELIGKAVYVGKSKIGKVAEYSMDSKSLYIQKLYVQPSLLKSFGVSQLIFDRQNIVEVTDTKIVVEGPEEKQANTMPQRVRPASSLSSVSTSAISE